MRMMSSADSGCVLKVMLMEFADGPDVAGEQQGELRILT